MHVCVGIVFAVSFIISKQIIFRSSLLNILVLKKFHISLEAVPPNHNPFPSQSSMPYWRFRCVIVGRFMFLFSSFIFSSWLVLSVSHLIVGSSIRPLPLMRSSTITCLPAYFDFLIPFLRCSYFCCANVV